MHFKSLILMSTMCVMVSACSEKRQNPLMTESDAPYGIINYEQVTIDDYREAMQEGMRQQKANIEAIVNNPEKPTFSNTIEAFDKSGTLLDKTFLTFGNMSGSNSTEEIRQLETEAYAQLSGHNDDIYLNRALFDRIKQVYDNHIGEVSGETEMLDHEQMSALKHIYQDFTRAGAALTDEEQEKLRALNLEISNLQVQFSQNLLHETNNTYVTVDSREELAGLPEANIEAAAQMAKEQGQPGKFMFNMQRPSCNPVLQYCSNRDVRRRVYEAYYNRGNQGNEWDNKEICNKLVRLRLKRAQLLGYKSCAEQILTKRMAQNVENVYDLLGAVWGPAVDKAKEELADIRREMKKDGLKDEPEGWDYMYYCSRAKAARFQIDEEKMSEYFEINHVLEGIFYVANRLYGLTFKEITGTVPTYEPSARVWEVSDKNGEVLAVFYGDYYPRDGKGAGAWMSDMRSQSFRMENGKEVRVIPIVQNVCNMTKASGDGPALQSIDNVTTMFHEFGHAMHFMMHNVHYNATYNVETDFVELPSQINEHWATEPEVLAVYAKHYKTGEVIPAEMVQKLVESEKYGQGFATVEYLAAAIVDMDIHSMTQLPADFDVIAAEEETLAKWGIPRQILPRYRVTNFSHCMGGGYTAGYYCYLWSEVLDCDGFEAFKETGNIFDPALAERFRKSCLEPGSIDDGLTMYRNFRGHGPDVSALLRKRGLTPRE